MADRSWKATERAIAARLGGRRVPITGRQRGDVPDVQHDLFAIEVKHRRRLPTWLRAAVAQALAAQRGRQVPIVVLHEHGTHHADDLVVLRLGDFQDWNGPLRRGDDQ